MVLVYVSGLIALLLTLILGVPYLDFLKKKMYGQYIREESPASHKSKAGTPTMGGIIIVIPAIIAAASSLFMAEKFTIRVFLLLLTFAFFCLAGYEDDITKVTKRQNKGISAGGKLILQILISLIPSLYLLFTNNTEISLFGFGSINLGLLYPIFSVFIITASSNAVNLTDGLDGLAGGTSLFAFIATTIICLLNGYIDLAIVSAAVAGSCAGFLYYNKYPAKIFMGDTGSLALGGALGALAVLSKSELWLLFIAFVFIIETLSVIIQVISFKTTGKRVFKMSPIHHHFELCGWHETKVVSMFWIISAISCFTAVLLMILSMYNQVGVLF
jgi:phospho-N-acetylmuramoyl-pentapeptide-transferase